MPGLRERIQARLTAAPAPADTQLVQNRNDRGSHGGRASRQVRAPQLAIEESTESSPASRPQPKQLAIEGKTESSPASRPQPRQLAITGRSSAATTKAPQQDRLTGSTTKAAGRPRLLPSASEPAVSTARVSRPSENAANQKTSTPEPSRRRAIGDSRHGSTGDAPVSSRNRPKDDRIILPPLDGLEITDVSDPSDAPIPAANTRHSIQNKTQSTRTQPPARAQSRAPAAATTITPPERSGPLTRIQPSNRPGNRGTAPPAAVQPHRGSTQTPTQPRAVVQSPSRAPAARPSPRPTRRASDGDDQQPQLYLGAFDIEEPDDSAEPSQPSNRREVGQRGRGGHNQPGRGGLSQQGGNRLYQQGNTSSRSGSFNERSSTTYTSQHTILNIGYSYPYPPPLAPCTCPYHCHCRPLSYIYPPYHYWNHLPWYPRPYLIVPRQTIFTEISTDYFESESPATLNLDMARGLEVINRYYNGWYDAYTQALSGLAVLSVAERRRIERNQQRLRERLEESRRRWRGGDQAVVRETLEQVRLDRGMAGGMAVEQVRWAVEWVREVWVGEHGEIPG